MRILAIESSTRYASAGVYECTCPLSVNRDEILLSLFDVNPRTPENVLEFSQLETFSTKQPSSPNEKSNSSSNLVPGIQQTLDRSGKKLRQNDLLAVALGPGSFTGLRIGVVFAKTFGYATNCKIKGVNTFDVLAYQSLPWLLGTRLERVSVGINIGRGEVLVSDFEFRQRKLTCVQTPLVQKPVHWQNQLDEKTLISGSGVKMIAAVENERPNIVPVEFRIPTNEAVAKLAAINFLIDGPDDIWSLDPIYSRPSAAEEKIKQ